uniref:Uncharacterized protein n=1 Tax=Salix viminalis TaxID=40686 RepID=A0A6N2MMD1_SALVM
MIFIQKYLKADQTLLVERQQLHFSTTPFNSSQIYYHRSIWTTNFMEGRSTGFHWMHHSPTMASFFAILASPSSSIWNRRRHSQSFWRTLQVLCSRWFP